MLYQEGDFIALAKYSIPETIKFMVMHGTVFTIFSLIIGYPIGILFKIHLSIAAREDDE
ncbi:hypothetical protein [Ectobacillus funiculus]|jgi:hypothetical protein|uniref:Uncharacterized protein n=1 Tax=Ectobacillus funiculus TaxID=137993 RepID=A0ABV5WCS9_9BACI